MSWDQYVDNMRSQSKGNMTQMQIIGYNNAEYITCPDRKFPVTAAEVKPLIDGYKRKNFEKLYACGPTLARNKYRFLNQQDNVILLKSKGVGSVSVAFLNTAAIVAFTPDGKQQGATNEALSKITTYLMNMNV